MNRGMPNGSRHHFPDGAAATDGTVLVPCAVPSKLLGSGSTLPTRGTPASLGRRARGKSRHQYSSGGSASASPYRPDDRVRQRNRCFVELKGHLQGGETMPPRHGPALRGACAIADLADDLVESAPGDGPDPD